MVFKISVILYIVLYIIKNEVFLTQTIVLTLYLYVTLNNSPQEQESPLAKSRSSHLSGGPRFKPRSHEKFYYSFFLCNYSWPLNTKGLNFVYLLYIHFFLQWLHTCGFHICGFTQLGFANNTWTRVDWILGCGTRGFGGFTVELKHVEHTGVLISTLCPKTNLLWILRDSGTWYLYSYSKLVSIIIVVVFIIIITVTLVG